MNCLNIKYSNPKDIQEEMELTALLDELDDVYSPEELKSKSIIEEKIQQSSITPELRQKIERVCAIKEPIQVTLRKSIQPKKIKSDLRTIATNKLQKNKRGEMSPCMQNYGLSYRNPSEADLQKIRDREPWIYDYKGAEGYTDSEAGKLFNHVIARHGYNNESETISNFKDLMYETGLAENKRFKRNTDATLVGLFNHFFSRYDPEKANNYHIIGGCAGYVVEDYRTLEARVPKEYEDLYKKLTDEYFKQNHPSYKRGKKERFEDAWMDMYSKFIWSHGKIRQYFSMRKYGHLPWFKVPLVESRAEESERKAELCIKGRHPKEMKYVKETIAKIFGIEEYKKACSIKGKESKRIYKITVNAVVNVAAEIKNEIQRLKNLLKNILKSLKAALRAPKAVREGKLFIYKDMQYYILSNKKNKNSSLGPPWYLNLIFQ